MVSTKPRIGNAQPTEMTEYYKAHVLAMGQRVISLKAGMDQRVTRLENEMDRVC